MQRMQREKRLLALFLALALLLTACGGGKAAAATMHLVKTEGKVRVDDAEGKSVQLMDNLGLFSGYGVDTRSESYAWIDLDEVKLTKMDQNSEITIQKDGKRLEIEVISGSLFFHVTEPLEKDEAMEIRASTMLVGIRGTCGWVTLSEEGDRLSVWLLEGKVRCEADGEKETVRAGEMAVMTEDGEITVEEFTAADIPEFVVEEIEEDDDLAEAILDDSGIDVLNPVTPEMLALEQYRAVLAQAETYFDDEYYGDDVPTITYKYTLAQMQTEHQIPALVLEQESESYWWGDICSALVFQYDPDSDAVVQAEGTLGEGVASAGGYRGALALSGDGIGILETSWSSGTGMGSIRRATLAGSLLQMDTLFDGFLFDDTQPNIESLPINWYDVSDMSGLNGWNAPSLPDSPREPAAPDTLPTDGDRTVLQGTVRTCTGAEILNMQGQQDPDPGPWSESGDTFRVIVLDTPRTVTARNGDGDGSRPGEATMIDVTHAPGLDQYDGQHVIFSIDPYQTWWPSGVSIPLGEPSTEDIHVLG